MIQKSRTDAPDRLRRRTLVPGFKLPPSTRGAILPKTTHTLTNGRLVLVGSTRVESFDHDIRGE